MRILRSLNFNLVFLSTILSLWLINAEAKLEKNYSQTTSLNQKFETPVAPPSFEKGLWELKFEFNGPKNMILDVISPAECSGPLAKALSIVVIWTEGSRVNREGGLIFISQGSEVIFFFTIQLEGTSFSNLVLREIDSEKYQGTMLDRATGRDYPVTLSRIGGRGGEWSSQLARYLFSGPPLFEDDEYWYPSSGDRKGAILQHPHLTFPIFCYPLPEGFSRVNSNSISTHGRGFFPMINYVPGGTAVMDFLFTREQLIESSGRELLYSFLKDGYSVQVLKNQ